MSQHLTPEQYVDDAIDAKSFVWTIQDKDFNSYNLGNINSNILNTQAVIDNQVLTKTYADQFRQEYEQCRQDLGLNSYIE